VGNQETGVGTSLLFSGNASLGYMVVNECSHLCLTSEPHLLPLVLTHQQSYCLSTEPEAWWPSRGHSRTCSCRGRKAGSWFEICLHLISRSFLMLGIWAQCRVHHQG